MGSIYRRKWKDKDGIIREGEILWIKYYRNGKPIRESTGSTKDADAKRLLKKREGEIAQGKLPGIYFDRVTFDELAEGYLADYRINDKNVRDAKRYVRHLEPFFGGRRVTSITTDKIKHYINKRLDADAANGTINRELSALRRMLNLGAQQTPPKVDKVPFIPMLKENNVRKGFFEHDEFLAVRAQLPEHLQGIATFGYKTGWRRSEITGLTWKQVDLKQGIVRLEPGMSKNKEARTVYLDDELKEMFKTLWENRKSALPYVFLNQSDTDKVKTFDKAWRTSCKKAGIGVKLFHDLRRTAVRNMVRSGTPERVAMMITGHKTRSVFDRYNIVDNTDLRLAAQRQAEYLESKMGTISGTIRKVISANLVRP